MFIKTYYNGAFHEVEVNEGDMVKVYFQHSQKEDDWFTIAEGQLVERVFKEGSLACGQRTYGILSNSGRFEPLVGFSSNYVKVEVL